MRPTVNSDESVTTDRSADVIRYTDHSSRHPKEQISSRKNAQTEYEAHLLQNAAHSSTYKSGSKQCTSSSLRINLKNNSISAFTSFPFSIFRTADIVLFFVLLKS